MPKLARSAIRLGMIAALAGLPVAGCGPGASGSSPDGRDVAERFLEELRAGRLEPAWQGTTTEFKSLMGLENLRDYVKAHPGLKSPAEHVESRDAGRDGRPMVEHVFRAEARRRGKSIPSTVKVLLGPADDGWGVERLGVE